MLLAAAFALVVAPPDTVSVRAIRYAPTLHRLSDSAGWGSPQIRIRTGQGSASVWLLAVADSVYVVALLPDTTGHWSDEFVVSLDTEGDRAAAPQHDDFQWSFRRMLDSGVVYRGRAGRWDAPQGDPDWRLGRARDGAGWSVAGGELPREGWCVVLRLDRGWLELPGPGPGLAFRIYDDAPGGWFAWPAPPPGMQPSRVEDQPALWNLVRPTGRAASSGAAPPDAPETTP
jgi:hypothetical protein